jgi:hypothetical protein
MEERNKGINWYNKTILDVAKMRLFRKIFGTGPPRDQWGAISLRIAKGLEEARKIWFLSCLEIIEAISQQDNRNYIKQKTLTGKALQAVKAYQLYWASYFIGQQAYIPKQEGKNFADILYAQVCGTEIDKCYYYFSRYVEAKDGGNQIMRFAYDFAIQITTNPLVGDITIQTTFPFFALIVQIVVAESFGDLKTAASLNEKLVNLIEKK